MNLEELKVAIKGSSKKHIIVGVCIFIFGAFFIIAAPAGLDVSATRRIIIATIIMGSVFALVGLFMMFISIRVRTSVNNGSHRLIRAINNEDTDALIWAHALVFKMAGNVTNLQNWNMVLYFKDGGRAQIEVKNEAAYNAIRNYLKEKFPKVELNYDSQIKSEMKEKYGFK